MIYITGDVHRRFGRLEHFCKENKTTSKDVMIVLGDASLNYYLNEKDLRLKERVRRIPLTFFFIHGNHEERPYLVAGYEEKEWKNGIVYTDPRYPNQLFAKDGEIYDLAGRQTIVIGGAYSVGKPIRLERGMPWFPSEQPDDETKKRVLERLAGKEWRVDDVLTHTCPYEYIPKHLFLGNVNQASVDHTTEYWLQKIENRLSYDRWFYGHYHGNHQDGKLRCLYKEIEAFAG